MPAPQASLSDIWRLKILADIRPGGNMERVTFTRTGVASYFKHDGTVGSAATGILRVEWLKDPVSGILQPYYKLEAGASNSCLQSQALATAPWGSAAATVTNNAAVAPDGTTTASYIVPSVANSLHYGNQAMTITANENLAWSGFIKSDGTYTGFVIVVSDAGVANGFRVGIDLATGTLNVSTRNFGTGTYAGATVIALGSGWYYIGVWGTIANGVTSATTFLEVFNTGANANTQSAFAGDAVHGVYVWGAQLERNGANALPPTSYIATTTIAVARGTERFSVPFFVGPGNRWFYVRMLERVGSSLATGFMDVCGISGATWTQRIYGPGTATGYTGRNDPSGPQNDTSIAGGNRSLFGEVVELLLLCPDDRTVTIRQSRNGGADVVSSIGAAQATAYPSSYGSTTLAIGENGSNLSNELFSRVLVGLGAGTTVQTIADVRGIP